MDQDQIKAKLAITQEMVDELPDYLAGDTLYRNLAAVQTPRGLEHPVLTLGALLENLQTLQWEERNLSADERRQLAGIQEAVARARRAYAAQWQALLHRELKAVADSWKWYLDDATSRGSSRDEYAAEVHLRARLDLLLRELGDDPAAEPYRRQLATLDERLRGAWQSGPYVGPAGAQSHYGPQQAWWLYGRPVGGRDR